MARDDPSREDQSRNDLIRGPNWRTRTDPGRRATAAAVTFAVIVIIGAGLMALAMWLLSSLDAPGWLLLLPWWLPTLGAVMWTRQSPTPAIVTDDDDDSWAIYSIRFVLVGADEPRPVAVRVIAAMLTGAPVCWALMLSGGLILLGVL